MGLAEGDSCKQDIDKVPDGHAKVRTVGGQAGVGPRFRVCFKTEHGTATTGEIPHVMVLALALVLALVFLWFVCFFSSSSSSSFLLFFFLFFFPLRSCWDSSYSMQRRG